MKEIRCKCGSTNLLFLGGDGMYKCNDCGEGFYSATGRMKKYIRENADATVEDLVENCEVEESEAIEFLFPNPTKIKIGK